MKEIDILEWSALDPAERDLALRRPAFDTGERADAVRAIIERVRAGGDDALREFSERFDGVSIDAVAVPQSDIDDALARTDSSLMEAVDNAVDRIRRFHAACMPEPVSVDTAPGLRCEMQYRPISPVGLYVPGGSAPLISTVLMLAVPAQLAGCPEIVLCTPPGDGGRVDDAILAAAARCGVRTVFRVGGAQAVAAMAFGTESVPSCAKIFGPGNAWVTEAKAQVAAFPDGAAQDMPAGPSEVLVIADEDADAEAVCWDLLSQAEHGPDSQSLLLSDSRELLERVRTRLPEIGASLPRADILEISLQCLRLIQVESLERAVAVSNEYAPEHLIINCAGAEAMVARISTAGSVFVGAWTPESLGDYCSGTNHVLPTYGYARSYSGLSVHDFMRHMTVQTATPEGLRASGPDAEAIAAAEGLDAHRMAVTWRLDRIGRQA